MFGMKQFGMYLHLQSLLAVLNVNVDYQALALGGGIGVPEPSRLGGIG